MRCASRPGGRHAGGDLYWRMQETPLTAAAPDLDHALSILAQAHRILAAAGQGDGTLGHVSLRDPAGRGFWLKRAEIGLDEVMDRTDMLLVSFSGIVLEGRGGLHSEWPLHAEVLTARDHLHAVVHTHAVAASLLSASDTTIHPFTTDGGYFTARPVPNFHAPRAHIDDSALARDMAHAMGDGPALLIRNHGLVTAGRTVELATLVALVLDRAAAAQLQAMALPGQLRSATAGEMAGREAMLRSDGFVAQTFAYYARRADR